MINIGGYLESGNCEDYYLISRCLVSGLKVKNLPIPLVKVRIDDDFISRRRGWKIGLDEAKVIKFLWKSNYINFFQFITFSTLRFSIRILPSVLIKILYKNVRSEI